QIVILNNPLTMSEAPAPIRHKTASGRLGANPSATTNTPQLAAASTTARPCRRTFPLHPDKSVITRPPMDIAEYSQPAAVAPPQPSASAGNSAIGIAKVIAHRSTT